MSTTEARLEEEDKQADELWKKTYGEEVETSDEEPVAGKEKLNDEPPEPPKETQKITPKPTDEEETYKKKFITLQGKYDAEVPRYAEQVRVLREEIRVLSRKNEELEERVQSLSEQKKVEPVTVETEEFDEVSETLKKLDLDYPDVGTTMQKFVDATKGKIAILEKKISDGKLPDKETESLKTEIRNLKKIAFDNDLKTVFGLPNWKELDDSPEFAKWLEGLIPYTNLRKYDVLQEAAKSFDAARVAQFFKDFLAENNNEVPLPVTPSGDENNGKNLEGFISPQDDGGAVPPIKKTVSKSLTREAYVKFMKDSSKGKFDSKAWGGKTEEEVEAMFHKAFTSQK